MNPTPQTPTPETDEVDDFLNKLMGTESNPVTYSGALSDFAHKLKRERDEARLMQVIELARHVEPNHWLKQDYLKQKAELAQLRKLCDSISNGLDAAFKYPRGSEAQMRCIEEVAQDFNYSYSTTRGVKAAIKGL